MPVLVPIIVLTCNVGGALLMAKYGLPSAIPLVGREQSDNSILGIVGLALFGTSIAIRLIDVIIFGL